MMKSDKGMTLLEALVSTVIIGIGFVAVFQMVNYSIRSIDVSSDRTKANYLTNVIAEDVISSRRETTGSFDNFSNYLISNQLNADVCSSAAGTASSDTGKIYGDGTGSLDAPVMKLNKWKASKLLGKYNDNAQKLQLSNADNKPLIVKWSKD